MFLNKRTDNLSFGRGRISGLQKKGKAGRGVYLNVCRQNNDRPFHDSTRKVALSLKKKSTITLTPIFPDRLLTAPEVIS